MFGTLGLRQVWPSLPEGLQRLHWRKGGGLRSAWGLSRQVCTWGRVGLEEPQQFGETAGGSKGRHLSELASGPQSSSTPHILRSLTWSPWHLGHSLMDSSRSANSLYRCSHLYAFFGGHRILKRVYSHQGKVKKDTE